MSRPNEARTGKTDVGSKVGILISCNAARGAVGRELARIRPQLDLSGCSISH
jgi:hypothetical protein